MKYFIVLCCVVVAVVAEDKYSDKYDGIDVLEFMQNKRLMASMVDCLDGKGPCSPEGKELKSNLQGALEDGCARCTVIQKEKAPVVIKYLIENEPELWKKATDMYDKNGEFRKKYEDLAKKHDITLP